MGTKFVKNAVGRMIPEEINGKPVIPFLGVHKHITENSMMPVKNCKETTFQLYKT